MLPLDDWTSQTMKPVVQRVFVTRWRWCIESFSRMSSGESSLDFLQGGYGDRDDTNIISETSLSINACGNSVLPWLCLSHQSPPSCDWTENSFLAFISTHGHFLWLWTVIWMGEKSYWFQCVNRRQTRQNPIFAQSPWRSSFGGSCSGISECCISYCPMRRLASPKASASGQEKA